MTLAAIYADLVEDVEIDRQAVLQTQRIGVVRLAPPAGGVATPAE